MSDAGKSTRIGRRGFMAGMSAATAMATVGIAGAGKAPARAGISTDSASGVGEGTPMDVGRGLADMTGEPLGAGMNGYSVVDQQSSGLHLRQFARAFVFADENGNRIVNVICDTGLMFQSIQMEVLRRLKEEFGDLYNESNVHIAATHTHVAPGGTSDHLLVDITGFGFRPVTFEATVAGIVKAIQRAHADVSPAELRVTKGHVDDAGVNRSLPSIERNPDKDLFPDGVNRDSVTLHVYKGGEEVGLLNWYGLHGTTYSPEHTLIDGDNKGYAAWHLEHDHGVVHRDPENAQFVAAFAAAPQGDITPNHGLTPGNGPAGKDQYKSAQILGDRQIDGTRGDAIALHGSGIQSVYKWVDMANVQVDGKYTTDGKPNRTGPAILGSSFAAGSQEDGGGELLLQFNENEHGGTPWVHEVNKVVVPPEVRDVHGNKDCLLPVGFIDGLVQQTHMFSIVRLAGLTIITNGFEPTTMSGFRMRKTVADTLGVDIDTVVCQGYTNSYGHYVTTPEEYDAQNYEGGATIFGRNELPAMLQVYEGLARALADGKDVDSGSAAGDLTGVIPSSPSGAPLVDAPEIGRNFGDVIHAVRDVDAGQAALATFAFANPNNDLRLEDGYLIVRNDAGDIVADDYDASTIVEFDHNVAVTNARVTWNTIGMQPGHYTLTMRGTWRDVTGKLTDFEGTSDVNVH